MTKVYVYFNLHKKIFSVRKNGKVIRHCKGITLKNATFKVSKSGRKRVIREKRKNVHAFVVGKPVDKVSGGRYNVIETYYNPYLCDSFVIKHSKEPITNAEYVRLIVINRKPHVYALEKTNEI